MIIVRIYFNEKNMSPFDPERIVLLVLLDLEKPSATAYRAVDGAPHRAIRLQSLLQGVRYETGHLQPLFDTHGREAVRVLLLRLQVHSEG